MPTSTEDSRSAAVEQLREAILRRISALLRAERIDPKAVRCNLDLSPWSLDVDLVLPVGVSSSAQDAFAVCVLDVVRSGGQTIGRVDVHTGPVAPAVLRPSGGAA